MNIKKLFLLTLLVFGLAPNTIKSGAYCTGGQCTLRDPYAPCDKKFAQQMEQEELIQGTNASCAPCNKQSVLSLQNEDDESDEYAAALEALEDESDENENDASDNDEAIDVYIIEYEK